MEPLTIRAGNAALAADVLGHGPTVVFLHAGVADRRSWTPVRRDLAADLRTVAYDRRGFGDTTYDAEPYSHVADLRAVIDAVDAGPVVLVGNSQGGRIAIDLALEQPQRVRALVLVAPAISGEPEPPDDLFPAAVHALDRAIGAADAAGDAAEVNRLEAHFWLDGATSPEGRVSGPTRALFLDMNARALAAPSPGEEREPPPAWQRLGELIMPTLAIAGDLDLASCIDGARLIADRAPPGELALMPGTAHLPQMEQPAVFTRLVRDFLARHGVR